ncbi:hypothetical protein D3C72_1616960 [compost metagenome]
MWVADVSDVVLQHITFCIQACLSLGIVVVGVVFQLLNDSIIILSQQITYSVQHGDGVIRTVELPVFVKVILRVKRRRFIDDVLVVHREVSWIHCIQHYLQFVCVKTVAATYRLVVELHGVTYSVVDNDDERVDRLGSQLR